MRKLYLSMLLLMVSLAAIAQPVTIGTGTVTTGQSPWDPNYGYSYTQTIYLQPEINGSGNITSISYYYGGTSLTNNQNINVWMSHVARSSFSSTSNWEPIASMTNVFTGTLGTTSGPGWVTITLSTPFAYNNVDNLLIAVHESSPDYNSTPKFYGTTIGTNRVLYVRSDATNPNPASPATGTRNSIIGNITIEGLTLGCQPPGVITVNNITTTSAEFSWAAPPGPAAASYSYEVRSSGAAGSGASGLVASGTSNTPGVTVSGLPSGSTLSFYAKSDCGSGTTSIFNSATTFNTLCVPLATPTATAEGFSTYLPNICWSEATGSGTPTGTTSNWIQDNFANTAAKGAAARINIFGTTADEWLISPTYDLGTTSPKQLELDIAFTGYDVTSAGMMGSDDKFVIYISADGGSSWTPLREWNSSTPISHTGEHVILDLTTYSGLVKFGFYGESTVGSNGDNDLFIDNVEVKVIPACAEPLGINSSAITPTGATIGWTASTSAPANYQLYYSTSNTPPADTTTPTVTGIVGETTNLTGLSPQTTYYVWVRSNCAGGTSEWSSLHSFTTACSPVASFNQNFDAVTTPALPICWSKIIRGSNVASATITTVTTNYSSPNGVALYNSGAGSSDDIILVSPLLSNLSAGTHRLRFYARNATASQDLEIGTLSDNTPTATFTVLQPVDINNTFAEYVVDFSTYGGTDQYIGIRRLSTSTFTTVYLDNIVWEAIPACLPPTGLQVNSTTTNSASLSWTPSGTPGVGYQIYYSTTNTAPADSTAAMETGIVTPQADLDSLMPGTTYYVWVRTDCGAGPGISAWSAVASFSTACIPIVAPTVSEETFTTYLPSICWSEAQGSPAGTPTGITSSWVQDDFANVVAKGKSARLNIFSTGLDEWLISPTYDLGTGGNLQLEFDLAFTDYNDPMPGVMGPDDKFIVLISTDDGSTWTPLREWTSANPISHIGEHVSLQLNSYTGMVKFAFYGESTASNADNEVFVDNVQVRVIPACISPSDIMVSGVTTDSATLGWTASTSSPVYYEIYYSTSSTAPDSSTGGMDSTSATSFGLGGLTSGSTYYVWVRSVCGAGNASYWVNSLPFNTNCVTDSVPHSQSFEGGSGSMPPCIIVSNTNADARTWAPTTDATYRINGTSMMYMYNSSQAADDWFFIQGLNLIGGMPYTLKFKYKGSSSFPEKLEVKYGTGATAADMTSAAIFTNTNIVALDSALVEFTPPTSGQYFIGFHAFSEADMFYLSVDDISLVTSASLPVTLENFKGERAGSANRLTWTTATESNNKGFELERSADGRSFKSIAFVASKAEQGTSALALNYSYHDMKPLVTGNYYRLKQVDNDGKVTYSQVVHLKGDKVNAVLFSSVYPNPAKDVLNVLLASPVNERVVFMVTDITGKVVRQQPVQLKTGDNQVVIPVSGLASGTYFIKAICASGCEAAINKFVKQ